MNFILLMRPTKSIAACTAKKNTANKHNRGEEDQSSPPLYLIHAFTTIQLNARRSTFCVLTSDKSMPWGENKIKFVSMIAVSRDDREIFQLIYPHIVDILCDYQQLNTLTQAKDFDEFIAYIQQVL